MKITHDLVSLVDDLAAHWTEPVLEILKSSGIRSISVDIEIEAWRTLKRILRSQFRWQRAFRYSTLVSLGMVMQDTIREAVLILARQFDPGRVSSQLEGQVRQWAGERRSTAAERRVFAEIVRQPSLRAAFKPPSRTDFTPRLQVSPTLAIIE